MYIKEGYNGITMGLLWDYYGITMGLLWDYYGITMGLLWDAIHCVQVALVGSSIVANMYW